MFVHSFVYSWFDFYFICLGEGEGREEVSVGREMGEGREIFLYVSRYH